jgi:DNA-binding CsgD family transcriptional regulator
MTFQLMNGLHNAVPRQRVEEAALALQLARARRLTHRVGPDELLTGPFQQIVARIGDLCGAAREVVSVQQRVVPLESFRRGHENNRRLVRDGVRMVSLYDTRNLSQAVLEFIAAADLPYHCCYGPVQMKILDGTRVLLDGPLHGDSPTVLSTEDTTVLAAARVYVRQVRATAMLAADYLERQRQSLPAQPDAGELLTERQRLVAELLDGGATDAEVAASLSLSVRTVRSEVARILEVLDARSRFGAGRRYAELIDSST